LTKCFIDLKGVKGAKLQQKSSRAENRRLAVWEQGDKQLPEDRENKSALNPRQHLGVKATMFSLLGMGMLTPCTRDGAWEDNCLRV